MKLTDLKNIGTIVAKQLVDVGIDTPEKLNEIGSKAAWLRIKAIDYSACIHRLCALEGAIRDIEKKNLPADVKADLKAFYDENK